MAFKNLEQRYNEKVGTLYAAAKMKFDGGKPTKGANDEPLIVRKPGDGYFGGASRALGRSLPLSSGIQDVKRLTLFTLSTRGIVFLLKQALLQTGNSFDRTRLINPLFTLGPAALAGAGNIVRMKRNLRPLSELVMRTDRSDANVRKMGALQESTFKAMKEKYDTKPGRFWVEQGALGKKGPNLLKKLGAALATLVSGFTAKQNIWDKEGFGDRDDDGLGSGWAKIRPEFSTIVKIINQRNKEFQESYHNRDDRLGGVKYTGDAQTRVAQENRFMTYFAVPKENAGGIASINDATRGDSSPSSFGIARWQALTEKKYGLGAANTEKKVIKYISDPSNLPAPDDISLPVPYGKINSQTEVSKGGWNDPVQVSFAMAKESTVRFRAFIKDVSQSVTPEYKTYQYVGRMEKFVTYTSVQREVSFKMSVLAFSKDELQYTWRRLNYLTGMLYPHGLYKGIYQPNIIRLTIGNLYWDQPGYFTSFNVNFNEYSWDIDEEIPIGADIDFKFIIIEKQSRIAQSPFYGITEDMKSPAFTKDVANAYEWPPAADVPNRVTADRRV
jgi:hypothetical protein